MSRQLLGGVLAAIGAVIVFLSAAADVIGLGGDGSAFGNRQVIGVAVGVVVVAAGLIVMYAKRRPA